MCSLCSLLFYIYEHLTTLLHICGWCLPLHAKLGRAEVYSVGVSFNLLRIHCACTHGSSWMRPIAKAQNDSTECEALHPSCDGLNRMHLLNSCMHALGFRIKKQEITHQGIACEYRTYSYQKHGIISKYNRRRLKHVGSFVTRCPGRVEHSSCFVWGPFDNVLSESLSVSRGAHLTVHCFSTPDFFCTS